MCPKHYMQSFYFSKCKFKKKLHSVNMQSFYFSKCNFKRKLHSVNMQSFYFPEARQLLTVYDYPIEAMLIVRIMKYSRHRMSSWRGDLRNKVTYHIFCGTVTNLCRGYSSGLGFVGTFLLGI